MSDTHPPPAARPVDYVPLPMGTGSFDAGTSAGNPCRIGLDRDGYIESMNAAAEQLLGWRSVDMLGKPVLALTGVQTGEALGHATAVLKALRSGRQLHLLQTRFRCREGGTAAVDCTAKPRDGGREGMLLTFQELKVGCARMRKVPGLD